MHQRGDLDGALTLYDRLLGDAPTLSQLAPSAVAVLHNNAGGIRYQRDDAEAAHAHFAAAVEAHPDHAESLVNLGLVLSEDMRRDEDALPHARRAVALRPEHAKSHHLLGNILQRLGQLPEAHLRFKTAEALAAGQLASAPRGLHQWRAAKLGERQRAARLDEDAKDSTLRDLELETISVTPPVFLVRGFLSSAERARVITLATPLMEESRTITDDASAGTRAPRVSQTAWLASHGEDVLEAIASRAAALLRLPPSVAAASERLQVLRYEKGGYFDVHHESTAFLRRYATLLYYLDGPGEGNGGGTVFPLGPDGSGGVGGGRAGITGAAVAAAAAAIGGGNVTAACEVGVRVDPTPGDAVGPSRARSVNPMINPFYVLDTIRS